MKILLTFFVLFFSSSVVADSIKGTAWLFFEGDHDKKIILFEDDQTFTYLNIFQKSGNQGKVFSDPADTWTIEGDVVTLSYTNGYRLVSLTINIEKNSMSGISINKKGLVEEINATKIE